MNPFESQEEYENKRFKKVNLKDGHQTDDKVFYNCIFSNCSFRETKFNNCKFNDCVFLDSDLSLISFQGCSFKNTRFGKSNMAGIDWTAVSWSKFILESPISFYQCVLNYSTFIGLSLHKISIKECTAKDVDFSEADLRSADFRKTRLTKSRFRKTNLVQANFEGAIDYIIDITVNKISKAIFSLPEAMSLLYGLDIVLKE